MTLRVGLAGAGWVAPHHLDAWAALGDRAGVVAIADPSLPAAEQRAHQFGVPAVFDSVDAMLERTDLDAIDVAAPREQHAPICRLAADHGLAILCQKPLAPTLGEAQRLVTDIGGRVRLMVHENWRFRPHYRLMHAWLRDGAIGEVQSASMAILTSGLLPDADGKLPALERQAMLATLDRMLLMEVMIHHVDTLRFLLGPLTLEQAELEQRCEAIVGEDRARLELRTVGGAPVALAGDFMSPGQPPEQFDALEIIGSAGSIRLRGKQLSLTGSVSRNETLDLSANYRASYRNAIAHFVDRLADGLPFETGPEDNLETLRLVEAAYRIAGHAGS